MAKSIGEVYDSAANTYTPPQWAHKGDHLRVPIERGAKAVLLYALDLMAAAGVTPEEAAAQLRAGKTIEEVIIAGRASKYGSTVDVETEIELLRRPPCCGGDGCVKPYGHEGLCVDSTGQARVTKEWLAKGAPNG